MKPLTSFYYMVMLVHVSSISHSQHRHLDNTESPRQGSYKWETGNWAGSVLSTCALMEELTGQQTGPVMDEVINNCPLEKCLAYGKYKKNSGYDGVADNLIIGSEPLQEITSIMKQFVKIDHLKSNCYRIQGRSKVNGIDEQTMLCDSHGGRKIPCCEGEYHVPGSNPSKNEDRVSCVGCLPHFFSVGPQKTGTTDLYNRIAMLKGVVPAHRKETGWWSEGMTTGPRRKTIAGYMLKFFPHLSVAVDNYDKQALGNTWDGQSNVGSQLSGRKRQRQRRLGNFSGHDGSEITPANFITGEATPSMFSYQHKGLSLIPRWIRCIYPPAKIIVTLRDPIERTYSDFFFYGKLQASKGYVKAVDRENYISNLTPATFDKAMRAEVFELRQCFEYDQDTKKLLFVSKSASCEVIRENQLGMLGFQSKRLPGRLLQSLYPLHISLWLRYFSCRQLLIVRSEGTWTEPAMREIALFLDVDPVSASKAAAATSVRPEQFSFNQEANQLGSKLKHEEMWNSTRSLLAEFFEDHWLARFPEVKDQEETCGL